MMSSSRPWAATLNIRLSRTLDLDTVEIVEFSHGQFTRRLQGPGGPLANPAEPLDEQLRRELFDELRAELDSLPADVDRDDLTAFVRLLEGSFALVPA
jgi:hypothetical protein